jgi:hypothetical protein
MAASDDFAFSTCFSLKKGYMYCEDVRIKTIQKTLASLVDQPSPCVVYSESRIRENVGAYLEAVKKARAPKIYPDGKTSVRGCIHTAWDDEEEAPTEVEIWESLIHFNYAYTTAKVTVQRKVPEEAEGVTGVSKGDRNLPTYEPAFVRKVWEKYEALGKPKTSEYERLYEEFQEVSKYYQDRLDELKAQM